MEISMYKGKNRSWAHWFEIPASNYDQAKTFYEAIYKMDIETVEMGPYKMGIIPHNDVGCAIISGEGYEPPPGPNGSIVYMDANPDLDIILNRIENAGRKIIKPKKAISEEHGFMATFLDSEGNRMALHSMK